MKFSVGYQTNADLWAAIIEFREVLGEVYFPWGPFANGRGFVADLEAQRHMESDLNLYSKIGLRMNLLLNGNCYGRQSLARSFYKSVGDSVDELVNRWKLTSVTTTSPLIAKFVKSNFPDLEVRASINMEIGTIAGLEYVVDLFDGFYLKREFNRDLARIREIRAWCDKRGKKLYMLANNGCLNFCSLRTFHDNLVSHEREIVEMDNAYEFPGLCHEYLSCPEKRSALLTLSNFVRPEDISLYEGLFDGIKLATRTNRNPGAVVRAYLAGRFAGNILDLTEPSHAQSFYPEIIENQRFPADFGQHVTTCNHQCENCSYCSSVLRDATVKLETE